MRLYPTQPPVADQEAAPIVSDTHPSVQVSIDIYRSSTDRSKYLSIPTGAELGEMVFPADTDSDLQSVSLYKPNVTIEAGKTAVGLDVNDILSQIDARGYACHGLKFSASLSVGVGMGVSP